MKGVCGAAGGPRQDGYLEVVFSTRAGLVGEALLY